MVIPNWSHGEYEWPLQHTTWNKSSKKENTSIELDNEWNPIPSLK